MSKIKRSGDLVAEWDVALSDGVHKIQFEHGTSSGKRVIRVDGKELMRKDWMFRLVGRESFTIGKQQLPAHIDINAVSGLAYEYTLTLDGKSLKKFLENKEKTSKAWTLKVGGVDTRIVLEKDTMDVWANGDKVDTAGEFVDDGTETHFEVNAHPCYIKAFSSGNRRGGIVHVLYVDDQLIPDPHKN